MQELNKDTQQKLAQLQKEQSEYLEKATKCSQQIALLLGLTSETQKSKKKMSAKDFRSLASL